MKAASIHLKTFKAKALIPWCNTYKANIAQLKDAYILWHETRLKMISNIENQHKVYK